MPAGFILFRGIEHMYNIHKWLNDKINADEVRKHFDIYTHRNVYFEPEKLFSESVLDRKAQPAGAGMPDFKGGG